MITLTLELDFPESENAKLLEKLSKLLSSSDKVKVKELRVGDKSDTVEIQYPSIPYPYVPSPTTIPNITWTTNTGNTLSDDTVVNKLTSILVNGGIEDVG